MSQHDYIISNATAINARADINAALLAIATQNSGAAAPNPSYANQLWLKPPSTGDANSYLYMRDSAIATTWYELGRVVGGVYTATVALASQVEAENGTDATKLMTPLRVKQSIDANRSNTHLAVNNYALLVNSTASVIAAGASVAGSTLRYGLTVYAGGYTQSTDAISSGTAASGTWRCMGSGISGRSWNGDNGNPIYTWSAGLFVRTA